MKAVIMGSTGLVGSQLLPLLCRRQDLDQVISLSRRPCGFEHPKLKEVFFRELSELPSFAQELQAEHYFCCLGTTIKSAGSQDKFRQVDFAAVLDLAKIAKSHGALSFSLVSATGANSQSKIFYNQVKGLTEDSLKALKLKRLLIYRPGLLLGARPEFRFGEKAAEVVLDLISPFLPKGLRFRFATSAVQLAEKMSRQWTQAGPELQIFEASEIARD